MLEIKDINKLQELIDDNVELNYRNLTDFLELPYLRGNAKRVQLKLLNELCEYEKNNTKYKFIRMLDYKNNNAVIINNKSVTISSIKNRSSNFSRMSNISQLDEYKAGIYKIQLDNIVYIGQTNNFKQRFRQHYYGQNIRYKNYGADTETLLKNGGTFEVLEFEDDRMQRLLKESYWVDYYREKGYKILNTEKVLFNESKTKPKTKCIKVLEENYDTVVRILKEKGLLYET